MSLLHYFMSLLQALFKWNSDDNEIHTMGVWSTQVYLFTRYWQIMGNIAHSYEQGLMPTAYKYGCINILLNRFCTQYIIFYWFWKSHYPISNLISITTSFENCSYKFYSSAGFGKFLKLPHGMKLDMVHPSTIILDRLKLGSPTASWKHTILGSIWVIWAWCFCHFSWNVRVMI